ncbi:MAG: hypothetical protein AAFN43_01285 [Pseudomonadota bacterium]
MLRLITKMIGIVLLVFAVIAAVLDLTRSIANSAMTITALGQDWADFNRESLLLLQPAVERYLHPFFWDPVIQNILLMPSWLVFFVLALIFLWMGRKRRRNWQERFGK